MANDRVQAKIDLIKGKDETGEVKASLNSFGSSLSRIGEIAAGVGIARVAEQIIDLGKATAAFAFNGARDMEQWKISFDTMLGSAEKSSQLLGEISTFAKSTPFELPQVIEGSKRLLAYNVSAEKIIPTFKMLGDVAAGIGTDKLPNLITAFGQISAKGRLMGTELLQLREAGFDLANAMGITNEKLEELVEDKAIKFADVERAFQKVTSQGGKFFNLMDSQSRTVGGVLSNIRDSIAQIGLSMMGFDMQAGSKTFGQVKQGSIFDSMATGLGNLMNLINQNQANIEGFFNALVESGKRFWDILVSIGTHVQTAFTPVLQHLGDIYARHKEAIDKVAHALGVVAYGAFVSLIYIAAGLLDGLGKQVDFLFTFFGPAWTYISDTIIAVGNNWDTIVNGMKATFESLVNGVIDGVNKIIDGFNKLTNLNLGKLGKVDFGIKLPTASLSPSMAPAYSPVASYGPTAGGNYSRNVSITNNNQFSTNYDPQAFASYQAWQINGR